MPRSIGGGLAAVGNQNLQQAQTLLGNAADQEQQRNLANRDRERARKAGNTQLGATAGASIGMMFGGPIGGLIGGVLGAVGGRLF